MAPIEFMSLSADEALQKASELERKAAPRANGFTKRSLLRQADSFRALAEIRQFARPMQSGAAA